MTTLYFYSAALTHKAWMKYEEEKYTEAVWIYDRVRQIEPQSKNALFGLALAYQQLKRYGKALYYYQQVRKLDPTHIGAWNNEGICYGEMGCKKAEIIRYRKAVEFQIQQKRETPTVAFTNLISTYQGMGKWKDALLVADLWVKTFPKCAEAHEERTFILEEGRVEKLVRLRTRTGFEFSPMKYAQLQSP